MNDLLQDRLAIRQLVEDWVISRDAGDWARLRELWHSDGRMQATWTQSSADEFVASCETRWANTIGVHMLGAHTSEVAGCRAVGQTKMQIIVRGKIGRSDVVVTCFGRFYDLLAKRDGRWGIVLRQPIYEFDTMVPVTPGERIMLDEGLLTSFPLGYRHLAYLQTLAGFKVKDDMPGLRGPAVEALYEKGKAWLIEDGPTTE